jgi:2-polyprenyl-6-methoxyphenol hydroxylase-like FAD-dependent oxidoreductase
MKKTVLVCGASFAGLSTAYWMRRLGYDVTVVEIAPALKRGGTPVNIERETIDVVKRMGLFDPIRAKRLTMTAMEFKTSDGVTAQGQLREPREDEYEIERDVLLDLLSEAVGREVEFVFGESVTSVKDEGDRVEVTFTRGASRSFELLFGCDGIHSVVRRLCFGAETEFSHFLQAYFSIVIVDRSLIPEGTTQMYNEPGKVVMLNAYNGKTDIVFSFCSDREIPYDYRDEEQPRALIREHFCGSGWRSAELLEEVNRSKTFYFDKLCQMKMPSWTKGRVALVGDAGYCASPAAGKGGSLAIDGAGALAAAFEKCGGDFALAFAEYDRSFRPYIEEVQADVVSFGLEMLLPRTEEAIARRNGQPFRFDAPKEG